MRWWWRGWRRRRELDAELEAELEHHRAMKMRDGATEADARRAVGSPLYWMEEARAQWGWPALEAFASDVRFAARRLRRDAVFTAVAVVTLALGVGGTTAIFSLLNGLIWRPLPVREPGQLVRIVVTRLPPGERHWVDGRAVPPVERQRVSYAMYESIARRARVFDGVFGLGGGGDAHLEHAGVPRQVKFELATGNIFTVLGIQPRAGRFFAAEDDVPGGRAGNAWPAVISDALWERLFQRSRAALGATVVVEQVPMTIVGVAPAAFVGLMPGASVDLWVPLMAREALFPLMKWRLDPGVAVLRPFARVRGGLGFDQVGRELDAIAPGVMEDGLEKNASQSLQAHLRQMRLEWRPAASGYSSLAHYFRTPLLILLAAVAAVLLIAATNLTSLFLARNTARTRELATRVSLGAPAARLRRDVLIESALLAMGGIAAGVPISQFIATFLPGLLFGGNSAVTIDTAPDARVFALLGALLAAVTLVAGGLPAWQAARTSAFAAMKGPSRAASRFRAALIVLQTAGSLVLCAGAAAMTSTLARLIDQDTGYAARTVFLGPDLLNAGIPRERMAAAYENILARLRSIPELEGAGWTTIVPMSGSLQTFTVNRPDLSEKDRMLFSMNVSDGYLAAAGIRLLAGRDLSPAAAREPDTAILSRAAAIRLYGSPQAALGQRLPLQSPGSTPLRVVGIAADALYQDIRGAAPAVVYRPYYRQPRPGYPMPCVTAAARPAP